VKSGLIMSALSEWLITGDERCVTMHNVKRPSKSADALYIIRDQGRFWYSTSEHQ